LKNNYQLSILNLSKLAEEEHKEKRLARQLPYRYYHQGDNNYKDKEEDYHKPPAFSRGFQKETIAMMWKLKGEIETLKDEVRKLRYHSHHNGESNGGPFTN